MADDRTAGRLSVQDLIEEPSLELQVAVPGTVDRRVRGAHSIEIEHPGPWLTHGTVMLTTGLRFVGRSAEQAQHRLVAELVQTGVSALLFGLGVPFEEVPSALVAACWSHGLALLTVPPHVPFARIENFVNRAVLSSETYLLKRTLWFQTELLSALGDDDPIPALVGRLASLVKGTATLYDEPGTVIASVGDGPIRLVWSEIREREAAHQRFTIGRWAVASRPVVVRGTRYWVALSSRATALDDLASPLLDSTEQMLAALRGVRSLTQNSEYTEARRVLEVLQESCPPDQVARLWKRLAQFRFVPHAAVRAWMATPAEPAAAGEPPTLDALADSARILGIPIVVRHDRRDGRTNLVGLVAQEKALGQWVLRLAGDHVVGLSEPFDNLTAAPSAFRDAQMAANVGQRHRRYAQALRPGRQGAPRGEASSGGQAIFFEDVDLATWLLASRRPDALREKALAVLGDLLSREDLVRTVVVYLVNGMDVRRTAAQLFLHENSVRHRLRRVEELIRAPLSAPAVVANLYLALYDDVAEATVRHNPPSG